MMQNQAKTDHSCVEPALSSIFWTTHFLRHRFRCRCPSQRRRRRCSCVGRSAMTSDADISGSGSTTARPRRPHDQPLRSSSPENKTSWEFQRCFCSTGFPDLTTTFQTPILKTYICNFQDIFLIWNHIPGKRLYHCEIWVIKHISIYNFKDLFSMWLHSRKMSSPL